MPCNVRLSHRRIATFLRIVTFFNYAPHKYSYRYLLTDQFVVDSYVVAVLWNNLQTTWSENIYNYIE